MTPRVLSVGEQSPGMMAYDTTPIMTGAYPARNETQKPHYPTIKLRGPIQPSLNRCKAQFEAVEHEIWPDEATQAIL
jgi:hypothetical protein